MSTRRTYEGMTLVKHVETGNRLKAAYRAALDVLTSFPKSSPQARVARRLEANLLSLKSKLDGDVCRMVPRSRDPRNLAIRVYYGEPFTPSGRTDPADVFAEWEVTR